MVTSRARSRLAGPTPAPTCWRDRRHTRGHHRRCRDPLYGRRDPGPAGAEGRRRARRRPSTAGYDLDQILITEDLVSGENVFFCATGVTDGDLLKGVHYYGGGCTTQSIVMRSKSGTVRMIEAYHRLSKLNEYSAIDFTGDSNAVYPLP